MGDWKKAIEALGKANEFEFGGGSCGWFFLAMAHWQLGSNAEARQWYDKAVERMDKNAAGNQELRRFRAEADELLRVNETSNDELKAND